MNRKGGYCDDYVRFGHCPMESHEIAEAGPDLPLLRRSGHLRPKQARPHEVEYR